MGIFPGGANIKEVFAGAPIKEVYAGSQLVWSAVKPSYGFLVGQQGSSYSWTFSPYSVWGRRLNSSSTELVPHPDHPSDVTQQGVYIQPGTYMVTAWAQTGGSDSGVRGIRATHNGTPIPGVSIQQTYAGDLLDVRVSAVVTLEAGWLDVQGYGTSLNSRLRSGSPARAGLTAVPYAPGSWPQTGAWSGNTTATATTVATFTIPESGVYDFEWSVTWGGAGSTAGKALYRINGGTSTGGNTVIVAPGTSTVNGSGVALSVGDVVEFRAESIAATLPATGQWTVTKT